MTFEELGAIFGAVVTGSGVAIGAESAMKVPAVNAAVSLIAGAVGTLPVRLYRQDGDSEVEVTDHPSLDLVNGAANGWQTAGKVRELATTAAILHGDGYGFVTKVRKQPRELIWLPAHRVVVEYADDTLEPTYKVGEHRYGADTVLHVQNLSLDGMRGFGLLRAGAAAIALAVYLERNSSALARNNSRPGAVLSAKNKLSPETAKRIVAMWRSAHSGDDAGGLAVLDGDTKYEPVAFNSVDSQHVEQRTFAVQEIARLTGVPSTLLQDLSKGSFANTEQQALQFLQHGLLPWLSEWTDAYARTLLTREERRTMRFEFDVADLLRADTQARASAFASLRAAGVITGNDARRDLNLPPRPDGESLTSPYTTAGNDNTNRQEAAA